MAESIPEKDVIVENPPLRANFPNRVSFLEETECYLVLLVKSVRRELDALRGDAPKPR